MTYKEDPYLQKRVLTISEKVANIMRSYSNKFTKSKVFFSPGLAENEVHLLEDGTLFGSAKDGLVPSGSASAESELVVTVIDRVPRLYFVRIVPVEEERRRLYNFINLPLFGKEYSKVVDSRAGLFSSKGYA